MDKAIVSGFTVLEWSKLHVYKLYYGRFKQKTIISGFWKYNMKLVKFKWEINAGEYKFNYNYHATSNEKR